MTTLQVGDIITTTEEFNALPQDAWYATWDGGWVLRRGFDHFLPAPWHLPVTVVYLPGQPPRPERVVKAEALREAAESTFYNADTDHARPGYYLLVGLAERVERGEA